MAIRAGFLPGTYTAVEARRLFNASTFAPNATGIDPRPGVLGAPGALAVTAFSGMSLRVAPGLVVVPGTGGYVAVVDQIETVTIPASTTTARWDLVILRVRDAELGDGTSTATIEVVPGTTTSDPPLPSTRCLVLARVLVGASVSSITSGAITDRRTWTATAGGTIWAPGALASTPSAGGFTVGQQIWDSTAGVEAVAATSTTWARLSDPARVWIAQLVSTVLVGVSTSTGVLSINLPADAPPGKYNIDTNMISLSDVSGIDTFVQVMVAGVGQGGYTDPVRNPASSPPALSSARHVAHNITHAGGALLIQSRLQINGGTAPYNRAMPGCSLRVTYLGRT